MRSSTPRRHYRLMFAAGLLGASLACLVPMTDFSSLAVWSLGDGTRKARFERDYVSIGHVREGTDARTTLRFINDFGNEIVVRRIETSCDCTSVADRTPIRLDAGDVVSLPIEIDTAGKSGAFRSLIRLVYEERGEKNDATTMFQRLATASVGGYVLPDIWSDDTPLSFANCRGGETRRAEVVLHGSSEYFIRRCRTESSVFNAEVADAFIDHDGGVVLISATPRLIERSGSHRSKILVDVEGPRPRTLTIPVAVTVRRGVEVFPKSVLLDSRGSVANDSLTVLHDPDAGNIAIDGSHCGIVATDRYTDDNNRKVVFRLGRHSASFNPDGPSGPLYVAFDHQRFGRVRHPVPVEVVP